MKQYDAIMIGFGKGAKTLAAALGDAGKTVAVIEKSKKMYGGTCINVGCIPSKSLVNSSRFSVEAGGDRETLEKRYTLAIKEKFRVTNMLRQKNFDKLNSYPNVTIITGQAKFIGEKRICVTTEFGMEELEGSKIFINTGSYAFIPPIPGLKESRFSYISEQLLDLDALPHHMIIIGGGYISMEFASIYTNFGAKVTVIQDQEQFLPREDKEITDNILKSLEQRGITVLRSARIKSVQDTPDHAILNLEINQRNIVLKGDVILIATGRRPNVESLNLEATGVALTNRGAIQTDEYLKTTNPDIWAMGDAAGGLQFTYISLDDYRIVHSQLFGNGSRTTKNRGAVPYSVFLDPPFSRVGFTEEEAIEQGYTIKIAGMPSASIPKAQVLKQTTGLLKCIIDAKTDQILGAHLFCAESHEMINILKIAMDNHIPYTVLRDGIFTHPTMSEALNDLLATIK